MFLPLKMTLGSSRILLATLVLLHGLAMWAVGLTALPMGLKGAMMAGLVLGLAWQGWVHRNFGVGPRIRGVRVDRKNALWLEGLGTEPQQAELLGAWLGPGLGLAAFSSKGRVHRLVWLPDSADRDDLRRWRVWLRWQRGQNS